jgi:uncharacterized membrane protein (UPF0127 family)
MSSRVLSAIILSFALWGCAVSQTPITSSVSTLPIREIKVGEANLTVEVADTDSARQQGLSGRESLPAGRGMLFTFPKPGVYGFWMKGMKFSLDFIWIKNGAVAQVTTNVPAPTPQSPQPVTLRPNSEVDGVIEVPAGWATQNNIQNGMAVTMLP